MCVGGAITTQLYYPSQATGCHSPCFVLAGPALSLFSSCTGMLGSQGARRLEVRPTWSQPRCCSPSQGADPYSPSSTSVGVRERVKAGSPLHLPLMQVAQWELALLPLPVSSRCTLSCPSRLALAAVSSSRASRSFTISMRRRSASCSCACCRARACCRVLRTRRCSSYKRHKGPSRHRAEEEGRKHRGKGGS